MSKLTVHGTLCSANARKVIAVADEIGVSFDVRETNVYQGAGQTDTYLSLNSLGQIPLLEDGDKTIAESNAILIYLVSKFGANTLYTTNPSAQAMINTWLFWESSQWQPILTDVMRAHVGHKLLPSVIPAPASSPDWATDKCRKQLAFLEERLINPWLTGKRITIADFAVAAMTTYFKTCIFPFENYPNISRWYSAMNAVESWSATESEIWRCDSTT